MTRVIYSFCIDIPEEELDIFDRDVLKKDEVPRNIITKNETINYTNDEILSFDDKISLKDLSFNYEGSRLKILNQINLIIKKGDKIGLLGKSGSGKTTFVNILSGLLQPTEGSIEIDNKKLNSNLSTYQKSIGYIPQDVYLFDDTIRNNIILNQKDSNISIKKLNYAIDKSQIKEFLSSLECGLNTIIGNKGIKISGGQRQRIGIARALYNDVQIIILDEATNALDDANENLIITEILENLTNKTIVVISHNLKTLQKCERILRIENGEIYEKN